MVSLICIICLINATINQVDWGNAGDELVASIINNHLDDDNEVYYIDAKQTILDTTNLTHQTRNHGSVGHSTVRRIVNKYDFTVSEAKAPKQRPGD